MSEGQPQGQPQGESVSCNVNLPFIKSKPGIFRMVAVGLGLLAMAFTANASATGLWYNTNEEDHCQQSNELAEKTKGDTYQCPPSILVIGAAVLMGISWVVTLGVLVTWMFLDLSQKGFVKIDYIMHLVIGVIFLLSTLLLLVFVILMYMSIWFAGCEEKRGGPNSCAGLKLQRNALFKPIILIIGLVLSIPAGVMYILSALMIKRVGGGGRGGPMMMGGTPSQAGTHPSPSQAPQGSVHASASPSRQTGMQSQRAA